ncbi:MAG: ABC transporter ATP-binding protein, partial [Pseudomonadota bacterium]
MSTIELTQVTKNFGTFTAVKEVDLDVAAGEVVCLLGPSGCGKTTTLRMVAGLESATAGEVKIGGTRVNDLSPGQRDIAMVFQFYALYPALTVAENLAFPLHVEKISEVEKQRRVNDVATILHLEDIMHRKPGEIAEGEKQRVAVARAIVREPNCFLFDEPLSRLDVELRQTMRGQIKEVLQGLSKASIIVTHDQLEALTMANRIAIMKDGEIAQIGTPHEVFAKPKNTFVASFIGTPQMNLIETELKGVEDTEAELVVEGAPLHLGVDAAVAGLSGPVTLGIRPRALTPVSEAGPRAISAIAELIEPMGAETLIHARIASGSHPTVSLGEGDTVLFSSKTIPGNEAGIYRLYNRLSEQGIRVIDG